MNRNRSTAPLLECWRDTQDCWRRLPNKAFFFGLLAAWLALFQFWGNSILGYVHTSSLFAWTWNLYDLPDGNDAHGKIVPLVVLGLLWWKRHKLLAQSPALWWPGIFILAGALALHVFGFLVQQPYISLVALFVGIFGLMGLAWGRAWLRHSLFPFWLFVFCIPLTQHGQIVTFPLQELVSWLTEKCAHGLGIDVIRVGTGLFDPSGTYQYEVAAACSGIHSLAATFLLAAVYGGVLFPSLLKRILLKALAVPLAVLGNLVRMLTIIVAATFGGQAAGNYVHEGGPLGLLSLVPYVPAFVGLLLAGRWLEKSSELRISQSERDLKTEISHEVV
jgi:exosortase